MYEYCFYFVGSVLLGDPGIICAETNEGSHVQPGERITLYCYVNNNGAYHNLLIWITPVSKIENVIALFLNTNTNLMISFVTYDYICDLTVIKHSSI